MPKESQCPGPGRALIIASQLIKFSLFLSVEFDNFHRHLTALVKFAGVIKVYLCILSR